MMARILYLGNIEGTSYQRAQALSRLGHTILLNDPYQMLSSRIHSKISMALHYRSGYFFVQPTVSNWIKKIVEQNKKVDLVWVDSGELLGRKSLALLKSLACPVILYNVDDPTGKRDGNRFKSLLKALPLYDLVVVVRDPTQKECYEHGAKKVLKVLRSYDEEAHKPFESVSEIPEHFRSDIAFIGTWMRNEKRDKFLITLIDEGLPVTIWGDRWTKSPYWGRLQEYYRGTSLSGRDYVAAMQGAKICLGFLSKGNRDLHTQRSLETPYAGGLFCAERTTEHCNMYKENEEAVFWQDAKECSAICTELLGDDNRRNKIRLSGMKKVRQLQVGNEDICRMILNEINF